MPKNLKPGDRVNGYEILTLLGKGAMATAFAARSAAGRKVFLKQYKSPTVTVPWYKGFIKYQHELKRRIESTRAKEYCHEFIEFFEAVWGTPCYFQTFEFVEKGYDLEKNLEQLRARPASVSWEQRLLLAKVLMAAIHALHESKIVHCDLKPPNIQLFRDDTIAAKYRLKLIDMDYSVLADVPAPWDGHQGYVGTAGYFSPEHLNGQTPTTASDVFTCGLILYELLAQGHPYRFDDAEQYTAAVNAHRAAPPQLAGDMPAPATTDQVKAILHRALSPKVADRPTARDINLVLNGRLVSAPAPAGSSAASGNTLELMHESGQKLRFGIRTSVGRDVCQGLGDDARFLDATQFTLDRDGAVGWAIVPNPDAANDTLVNGRAVATRQRLLPGDVVAVGRAAKGITKLPMKVQIV